jgi:hypothetical protein
MTEVKKDKQIFTVARVFFLLIVLPLSLMAILIANGIFKLGITAKERAVTVLDQKSQEEIKIRAINVADEIATFLTERRKDLFVATILPASESAYKLFLSENKRNIWVKENDKINQVSVPLYTEMALIDRAGNEVIKIANGSPVPKSKLTKAGDYFAKAKSLNKGEIFVSPVSGLYVNRSEFEKGKRFNGTLRMTAPVFGQEGLTGVITLAVDYRHLAGFTDHIIPTQQSYVYEADAASGNYAYMVDWRGFCISHPNDFHIEGKLADGTPVPPLTKDNYEEQLKKGQEVLDFKLLGFMDPALPEIAKQAEAGNSGIKEYKFGGRTKFVAYAPIKFSSKDFKTFGWIGMGVDVEKFNELAMATSKNIEKEAKAWSTTIILILGISIILLFAISALLARGISRSIEQEVPEGSQEVVDYYEDEEDK